MSEVAAVPTTCDAMSTPSLKLVYLDHHYVRDLSPTHVFQCLKHARACLLCSGVLNAHESLSTWLECHLRTRG